MNEQSMENETGRKESLERRRQVMTAKKTVKTERSEQKAKELPDAFTGTAETVYDFIVAYEVNGDD